MNSVKMISGQGLNTPATIWRSIEGSTINSSQEETHIHSTIQIRHIIRTTISNLPHYFRIQNIMTSIGNSINMETIAYKCKYVTIIKSHVESYGCPNNMSYLWNMGFFL